MLNCEIGEVCPSDKYAILIQYWGKFTFMEGKKSKVISDGSQIRLRVEDSYYKQFANNEWFQKQWFPDDKENFSKIANAKIVEIQIGERKY